MNNVFMVQLYDERAASMCANHIIAIVSDKQIGIKLAASYIRGVHPVYTVEGNDIETIAKFGDYHPHLSIDVVEMPVISQ